MFPHLSFDTPLQEGGKLTSYDNTNVYILARESFANVDTYRFMSIRHDNLSTTSTTVYIEGFILNGMCQHDGTLDYFIGRDSITGDIKVCNFRTNTNSTLSTYYCKDIPKNIDLEPNFIYSDCKYTGTIDGMNTYIIAIGASAYDTLHPGQYNYFYAKFNTRYNLTETLVESHDPEVSERLSDVKVDIVNDLIYVVLNINSNEYLGVSIFEAGDEETENNPNVALLAYNIDNAYLKWVKIFGDLNYSDYYAGLADNRIVINSYTSTFSSGSEPNKDILVYEFSPDTGITLNNMTLGSPVDDEVISVVTHMHSTYILAKIGNNFYPHPNVGSVWGTTNNETVVGLIWINGRFEMVDIEGYLESSLSTVPMRAFPSIPDLYEPQFMFFSPASKLEVNGLYLTQFDNPIKLYSTVDCNLTCLYCDRYTKSKDCIYCDEYRTEFLYKGECLSACEDKTYQINDEVTGTAMNQCNDCHYSCKTCLGPKKDQCATCCTSGDCGSALLDREPDVGKCKCPSGTYDSQGTCLEQCENGYYGRLGDTCYESCPYNTYAEITYDDSTTENEFTHFEYSNDTDCTDYNNLLKFNIASKGIEVPGPTGLSEMMKEFTLSLWARADLLSTETFLLNLFDRVHLKIQSSQIKFLFENSAGTYIEPTYSGTDNQITLGNWFYVSISQKEHKELGLHQITQKLVVANGRTTDAVEAGTKTDHTPSTFHKFVNSLFIGGLSYSSPKSFTGYIKEVKLFSQFHDSPQMISDKLRVHKLHSYDDPSLIAYWKLSENYTEEDELQVINDYSKHSKTDTLSVSFSPSTNPDYPTFVLNNSLGLKLCYFHDVATCIGVKNMPQIISRPKRLVNLRNFDIQSLTHTVAVGDTVEIKDGDCQLGSTQVTLTKHMDGHWEPSSESDVEQLEDGKHYHVCYTILSSQYQLSLGQFYLPKEPRKVDPSDISTFIIVGLEILVDVSEGDEAYGNVIRFSEDCDVPQTTDLFISRTSDYLYSKVITKNFQLSKRYKMCSLPTYASGLSSYMDGLNNHEWISAQAPQLSTSNFYSYYVNQAPLSFISDTPITDGDKVVFAWKRDTDLDCDSGNYLSPEFEYTYGYPPLIWLGHDQGIHGVDQDKEEVHMCWKSNSIGGDPSYSRVGLVTGHNYAFLVKGYGDTSYTDLPELSSVYPPYGSTELYGTDAQIQFSFDGENVFPAKRGGVKGKLGVYRGAIKYNGEIEVIPTSILYEIATLDEANVPLLQQGNIDCTATGVCNLTLSTATSTAMAPGEIYFLGFFEDSWASDTGANKYLFGSLTNAAGEAIYYHMFMSRSFNIISTPTAAVFGKTIVIEGVNLLEITDVLAKESSGSVTTGNWTTRSIKISLSFSGSTCSSSLMPFASVYMENVNSTHITITNMDLKGCNNGNLIADFEMIRGIKEGIDTWTHERREYQKGVDLGIISCDSSCLSCSGPSDTECLICANHATDVLLDGKCYTSCPTTHPTIKLSSVVFQATEYEVRNCVADCGIGYFIHTERNQCEACNLDCQTCTSNQMFGCITCNPIKYFYYGMCTEVCPTPEYLPQNTNYECVKQNTTKYIEAEILKEPYLYKLPRNKQIYLKAYIDNSRGAIDKAFWTQISPSYSKVTDNLFTMEINTLTNEVYNRQLSLKMKMTSFTYISEVTSIKIMLEVNNTMGDSTKQLTEFYVNPAPTVGTMTQEIISGQTKPEDGATTLRIRLNGWYNNIDDSYQKLKFKLYYIYDGKIYILKNAGNLETFDTTLPYIGIATNATTRVTIQLCVDALDEFLAISTVCIDLKDVLLTYMESQMATVTTTLAATTFTLDEQVLVTSASLEVLIPQYYRSPAQPHLATVDFHCYNGDLDIRSGSNYCKCRQGFGGLNCQYTLNSYYNIKATVDNILAHTWATYGASTSIELFDFDIIVSSLRGMLKDPDLISYSDLEKVVVLFEKVSNMEGYKVIAIKNAEYTGPTASGKLVHNSIKMYFQVAERMFAKLHLENKKIKAEPSYVRYPGLDHQEVLDAEKAERTQIDDWSMRAHDSTINFIKEIMYRLGTEESEYSYIGDLSFEFKAAIGYPPDFENKNFFIRNSDVFWSIPSGVFSNYQNVASSKHQVYVLAIKWLANPHLINGENPTSTGTNMTTLAFYDGKGTELKISNLTNPVSILFPYRKASGFSTEFLKCQYYSPSDKKFFKDGCGHAYVDNIQLPCTTCADDNSYIITSVFLCRCNHLTTIGGVYEPNSVSKRVNNQVGLYLNYYAMNYWNMSFGYYLVWPVIISYMVSILIAIIFDCFTISNMRKKIQKRIILVGRLNEEEKGKDVFLKEDFEEEKRLYTPEINNDESISALKKGTTNGNGLSKKSNEKDTKIGIFQPVDEGSEFGQNEEMDIFGANPSAKGSAVKPKKKKKIIKKIKKKPKNNLVDEENEGGEELTSGGGTTGANMFEESKGESNKDSLSPEKPVKKKKIIKKKKKVKSTNGDGVGPAKTEEAKQTSKDMTEEKKEDSKNKEDSKADTDAESSKSTKEESVEDEMSLKHRMPNQIDVFEYHRDYWTSLFFSNTFTNAIFVTSYLCPRHVRVSMLYLNLTLIWFLVAVFYNNTKDPLVVPNFDKKARNLATSEIWIALLAPLGSMSISYIFWGVFKISDRRFHQPDSYQRVKDGTMIKHLMKEMYLRFFMAYFIMIAIFGAIMWYIIEFTAKFGWKVSWMWWYSGTFAVFFNYCLYDPIVTWFHYVMYGCSIQLWKKIMAFRSIKIACPEILDQYHIPPLNEYKIKKMEEIEREKIGKSKQIKELEEREDDLISNASSFKTVEISRKNKE